MTSLQVERQLSDGVDPLTIPSLRFFQTVADAAWNATQRTGKPAHTSTPDLQWFESHVPLVVGLRAVDAAESRQLNHQWRERDRATNVLSFPAPQGAFVPPDMATPAGDLVICACVVGEEAAAAGIAVDAHWAHMVVHGCLHLLGFDHIDDADAELMAQTEIEALACLGFADPYLNQ